MYCAFLCEIIWLFFQGEGNILFLEVLERMVDY